MKKATHNKVKHGKRHEASEHLKHMKSHHKTVAEHHHKLALHHEKMASHHKKMHHSASK